ncbi:hypothetical protein LY78DRAFT_694905 [Colletotrichum sublineola]|nr:hypothetical protein LY78DRAFT_694905 [Colletotrichum sublineola]
MADDFQETMFLYPSKLPPAEQEALRVELHKAVLRLGFTSGVFHVEARMAFLIEGNARSPGYMGLMTIAYTYGIGYYALWGLNAVGDASRFRAMARPFLDGPQYTSALVLIMPDRVGTLVSEDPAPALRRRRLDLMGEGPLVLGGVFQGRPGPRSEGPVEHLRELCYVNYGKMLRIFLSDDDMKKTGRQVRTKF